MGFKKQSVVGSKFSLKGSKTVSLNDKAHDADFENRIYLGSYVDKINRQHKNMRQVIVVDWEETAKRQLEAGNTTWKSDILESKEDEAYDLKMEMNFPTVESYTIASSKPKYNGQINDYLLIVERDIEIIKSIELVSDNEELETLKAKAKELGITLKGKQTVASIQKKIDDFNQD
tara:strand:+ start:5245 stop:5769 length:525 start_codon:yes stop_codon:yes gene_type:complete